MNSRSKRECDVDRCGLVCMVVRGPIAVAAALLVALFHPRRPRFLLAFATYPFLWSEFPRPVGGSPAVWTAGDVARQRSNRARLGRIAAAVNGSAICAGPFDAPSHAPLRLLHVPKTGSTFTTAYLRHACPAMPASAAMGAAIPPEGRWAAAGRRGIRDYDALALLEVFNASCPRGAFLPLADEKVCRQRDGPRAPPTCRPDAYYRARRAIHHQEFNEKDEDPGQMAGFFRSPSDRLLSAYHFGLHAWGLAAEERTAMERAVKSPAAFARYPGIAGCAARLLGRCACGARDADADAGGAFWRCDARSTTKHLLEKGPAVGASAAAIVERMAFVGISELSRASVCLFHRIFGGDPAPDEFAKYRVGKGHGDPGAAYHAWGPRTPAVRGDDGAAVAYDAAAVDAALDGYVDALDEVVYEAALLRFSRDLEAHAGIRVA